MSVWDVANISAWVLAGLMLFIMIRDFVNVERRFSREAEKEAKRDV